MAGTSILKLKVDDKEYNASLKQAQQGMLHLEKALQNAGKSFSQVDKSVVDYVRGIGQMEAQSKTARGRISEMSNAFIELSLQYKNMSDEVKSGDVGKALAESMETLKQRTIGAKQELEKLNQEISVSGSSSSGGGLLSGLGDKVTGMMQVFGGNMLAQGVASLTSELVGSVQQSIELAKQGEGVRIAFERLNRPGLLDNLKEATHGTVSEVELMKQAIKFDNFKLPVEDLATYLGFAQQKAKDTGESIDYLVNSIVTGLGRQSKQILDNLGISAAELTKRMDEGATMTQAVADIIREEMAKAGDYVETAADRAARATAKATDEAEAFGREAMPIAQEWEETWAVLKSGAMSFAQTLLGPVAKSLRSIQNILNSGPDVDDYANRLIEEAIKRQEQGKGSTQAILQKIGYQGLNNLQTVHAPGGYVVVSDGKGNVLGQRHFDDLSGVDAWRASLGGGGGRRGGGRTGRTTHTPKVETPLPVGSVAALNKELSELRKQQELATSTEKWDEYQAKIDRVTSRMKVLKGEIPDPSKIQQGKGKGVSVLGIGIGESALKDVQQQIDKLTGSEGGVKIPAKLDLKVGGGIGNIADTGKETADSWKSAANAIQSVGSAMQSIEDPSAKIAGIVAQAIATVAMAYAQALSTDWSSKSSIWTFIAAAAASTASMIGTIASIHSATGYARGGIVDGRGGGFVPGTQTSGDNVNARLDAGELVLNRSQQSTLADHLQGNPLGDLHLTTELKGTNILISIERTLKSTGKGQLVTFK